MKTNVLTTIIHLIGIIFVTILSSLDIIPTALHISYVFSASFVFIILQQYIYKKGVRYRRARRIFSRRMFQQ